MGVILRPRFFVEFPQLRGGFSTPLLGNQSFSRSRVPVHRTRLNREHLARVLGISAEDFVSPQLVHGKEVLLVGEEHRGNGALAPGTLVGDGLITGVPNLFLLTTQADCLPLLFWEPQAQVVAALHAGRRGLLKGILREAVEKMGDFFAISPEFLYAAIGPSIRRCCYGVDRETCEEFRKFSGGRYIYFREDQFYLDLAGAAKAELLRLGLRQERVEVFSECTCCGPYFSARRDGQQNFLTQANVIGVKV
ncbi:MAG: laccase domain-containing protein [Planctomycetota bacterium]|nr:MAG: laccase domain-containing protein [Planctomycetota bacterium]